MDLILWSVRDTICPFFSTLTFLSAVNWFCCLVGDLSDPDTAIQPCGSLSTRVVSQNGFEKQKITSTM